ncbi:MAG: arginase [Bacteroidetes bacterium]|nr:arginase [Bacteroidota bacterium]
MDLSIYFDPIEIESLDFFGNNEHPQKILNQIWFTRKGEVISFENMQLALIGVPESRNSAQNEGAAYAPDEIRREFYKLFCWNKPVNIIDLGNLKVGKTVGDTYEILAEVLSFLIENKIIPIILGGSNDLLFSNYMAYARLEHVVNIVSVDACFDLGNENIPINSNAFLNKIILKQPNYLLNYANIGYQSYMNSPDSIDLMEQLFFETYRVGSIRKDMEEVEPIVRNAEICAIDLSSVRRGDAPGNPNASSNGFYGEEICRVAMFAGVSDKLSSFGIYEYNPTLDYNNQTSQLIAHIIWYFIEGFNNRIGDTTFKDKSLYIKHSVAVSNHIEDLVFYCSKKSGRWWMVVPITNKKTEIVQKYYLPCSVKDYELACADVISERWWKAFHKLNR